MIMIIKYRKRLGWTQAKLADALGVAQSTVAMWEKGERKPDIVMLKAIANILSCTTDDLLSVVNMKEETNNE